MERTIAPARGIGEIGAMGWKARPGSAEELVRRWASSTRVVGIVFLWCSALSSAVIVWAGWVVLKPEWRWLVLVPLAYGAGAALMAESLRRGAEPSKAKWLLVVVFAFPPILKIVGDTGFFEAVAWLIRSAHGS